MGVCTGNGYDWFFCDCSLLYNFLITNDLVTFCIHIKWNISMKYYFVLGKRKIVSMYKYEYAVCIFTTQSYNFSSTGRRRNRFFIFPEFIRKQQVAVMYSIWSAKWPTKFLALVFIIDFSQDVTTNVHFFIS